MQAVVRLIAILILGFAVAGNARSTFGRMPPNVTVHPIDKPEVLFNWKQDRCDPTDTPDAPPRAFRDASGTVHLFSAHDTLREFSGPTLDLVHYDCRIIRRSAKNDGPEKFSDHEWLAAPYTLDGRVVYALVHDEFDGYLRPALCPSRVYSHCWYNALTFMLSTDGGKSYVQPPPPANLVAVVPYQYPGDVGFPVGYFMPSNIMELNGYYYTLFRARHYLDQQEGVCLMRTNTLSDPTSWRAWDGHEFSIRFVNPYTDRLDDLRQHLCIPLSADILIMGGISRDPKSRAFVLVMKGAIGRKNERSSLGIWATASYDLIDWSKPVQVWADPSGAERDGDARSTDRNPSLLDPTSSSPNFDTIGSKPYIYFVQLNPDNLPYDRLLMRVRVEVTIEP